MGLIDRYFSQNFASVLADWSQVFQPAVQSVIVIVDKDSYYVAGSASGHYEANPVFWLATWAGKMRPNLPASDKPPWSRARI